MKVIMRTIIFLCIWSNAICQTSFTMKQAVDYAIEHSILMKREALNILDAEQIVKEYKSTGMPKLNIGANYNYYFFAPTQPTEDFLTPAIYNVVINNFELNPAVPLGELETFQLPFFRKQNLRAYANFDALLFDAVFLKGLKAARLSVDLEQERTKLSEQEIGAEVLRSYLGALIGGENLKILKKNIENVDQLLFETKEVYKAGFAESLDVARLQLSSNRLKTEEEKLERLIEISQNVLKYQMNYPIEDEIVLTDNIEVLLAEISLESTIDMEDINFENRPETTVIEKAIELDQYDIDRLGLKLPVIKANIGLEESLQRNKIFDGSEPGFIPTGFIGLNLNYALWDGNLKKSQRQRSIIRQEKRKLELKNFKRSMHLQVLNESTNLDNAKATLQNRTANLEIVTEIYDKTKIKFTEGVGSTVELSQAESSLYQAQSEYINAMYDVVTAHTELNIALGNYK